MRDVYKPYELGRKSAEALSKACRRSFNVLKTIRRLTTANRGQPIIYVPARLLG